MSTPSLDSVSCRVLITETPFPSEHQPAICAEAEPWPAKWISVPNATKPFVAVYRRRWTQAGAAKVRLHVSGDERYELWLNGQRLGRGPERCTPRAWAFESYEVELPVGENVLVARVWALGKPHKPHAQFSSGHGFFLAPEPAELRDVIGTGFSAWDGKLLDGYEFLPKGPAFGQSAFERQQGGDIAWRRGGGTGWAAVVATTAVKNRTGMYVGANERRVVPAELPPMMDKLVKGAVVRRVGPLNDFDGRWREVLAEGERMRGEEPAWQRWLDAGEPLVVPARTRRRVIIDLQDYYCSYPELRVSGGRGARIGLHWEEALYCEPLDRFGPPRIRKGQRDQVDGRYFCGLGEEYLPQGGEEVFDTLWWRPARYVEIAVETGDEALTLRGFDLRETRYPYARENTFESDDRELAAALVLCERGEVMGAHETFLDPFYEQLQYLGDGANQAITMLVSCRDSRLVRRWLNLAHQVRTEDGMTAASMSEGMMIIAPFGFYWMLSLRDYLWWREDADTGSKLIPGARAVIEFWLKSERRDGLIVSPPGWNFVDWVRTAGWHTGTPPGGLPGELSSMLNWMAVWAFSVAADLERYADEPELVARCERLAGELHAALDRTCWNAERGLYADTPGGATFSQHPQIFAIMSGHLDERKRAALGVAMHGERVERATVSFGHYLLNTYHLLGNREAFDKRLDEWRKLPALGFKAVPVRGVHPEIGAGKDESRSDCHPWGSHPLFHVTASILGVRPAAPGFAKVHVKPLIAPGKWARGTVPHPRGTVKAELRRAADGAWSGEIELPAGVDGVFEGEGRAPQTLRPGKNRIE